MKKNFVLMMVVILALLLVVSCENKSEDPSLKGLIAPEWAIGKWEDETGNLVKMEVFSDNFTLSAYADGVGWVTGDQKALMDIQNSKITKQISSESLWEIHLECVINEVEYKSIVKFTKTENGIKYYELDTQNGVVAVSLELKLFPVI